MIALAVIVVPLLFAAVVCALKTTARTAAWLTLAGAAVHFLLVNLLWWTEGPAWFILPGRLAADLPAQIILWVTSCLASLTAGHLVAWLPAELAGKESLEAPAKVLKPHLFAALLLAFLSTMSLVCLARNYGLLWVAVEATTLSSAPLILFHRHGRSLEAMWKYLLICSVGIGLALFGTMLLAVAVEGSQHGLDYAVMRDAVLSPRLYRAAFIFILAGYGTKMGLAPFHTWLPDAHSEAPGPVSALLSGALLNCSFLGIIRFWEIAPESEKAFLSQLLLALGFLSLATAALFIIHQTDFKRMLAYSSVEHMGILALLLGCGALGTAQLHLIGHSLVKLTLFLVAGNTLLACGTRQVALLGGLHRELPRNSKIWLIGLLFICGMPPSPLFATELHLLALLPVTLGILAAALLFVIFAGMSAVVLRMIWGEPGAVRPAEKDAAAAEKLVAVPRLALLLALFYGLYLLTMLGEL